ncbi:MAG: hypothetical protein HQK49_12025 [Oligoflexia bacterium]|nr:hypothetical protein [Oligoflexia bacterium]
MNTGSQSGVLMLVPTPINELLSLDVLSKEIIERSINNSDNNSENNKPIFVFEERSCAIKRWVKWGFPRGEIDNFYYLNEHNEGSKGINGRESVVGELIQKLISGHNLFLMSDGGLPGFCDPGTNLINLCHKNKIKVTAAPFANSLMLAIVLSGFSYSRFVFEGFVPHREKDERSKFLERILKSRDMSIVMDTPYRLCKLLEEISGLECSAKREFFLAMDLNDPKERMLRGKIDYICKNVNKSAKHEFVLVIAEVKNEKKNNNK